MKWVKSVTDGTVTLGDMIVDIRVQVPVGAASAEVDSVLDDAGDTMISAVMQSLAKNLDITY